MQYLPKERSKNRRQCKNLKLHFGTTLNYQFHLKLGIKPSQAAYGQSHMQTFWSSTRATKKFNFEVSSHTNKFLEMDQIQIKFATGSNCGKISKKGLVFCTDVSSSKAICKLLRNLTNKLVIAQNIHSVGRFRPFFSLPERLKSLFTLNLRAEVT